MPNKTGLGIEKVIQKDADYDDEKQNDDDKLPCFAVRMAKIAVDDGLPVGGPLRVGLRKLLLISQSPARANPPGG